jgi:hypothetical protein
VDGDVRSQKVHVADGLPVLNTSPRAARRTKVETIADAIDGEVVASIDHETLA